MDPYLILAAVSAIVLVVIIAIFLQRHSKNEDGRSTSKHDNAPTTARGTVLRDIKFLRELIVKLSLPKEHVDSLNLRLNQLEVRAKREDLRLAVIGEFNSGKSTFINAMLRQRLLKADNRATTAAATEIRFGKELKLAVKLHDGTLASGTERDTSGLAKLLARYPQQGQAPATLQQWVDLTTSDPEISRAVEVLAIEAPATWLKRGVCILDTPGVGAGADNADHHQAVTERVLADQADAAVILISAQSSVTKTLLDFMDAAVRPFLDRCIFIVTKMDAVDPEEQPAVISYITNTLTSFLGRPPRVLNTGAQKVLLAALARNPEPNVWESQFVDLENQLMDTMSQQAPAIIAETLVSLLNDLMVELKSEIVKKQAVLTAEQKVLNANSIENLETVMSGLHAHCQKLMNEKVQDTKMKIEEEHQYHRVSAENAVRDMIEALTFGTLKETITAHIPYSVQASGRCLNDGGEELLRELGAEYTNCHQRFITEFERHYQNLKALGIPPIDKSLASISTKDPSPARDSILGSTPFKNGARYRDYLTIGFAPASTKKKISELMMPAIRSYMRQIASAWQARLNLSEKLMQQGLKTAVDSHVSTYRKTVAKMIQDYQQRQMDLAQIQATINGYLAAIEKKVANLNLLKLQASNNIGSKRT